MVKLNSLIKRITMGVAVLFLAGCSAGTRSTGSMVSPTSADNSPAPRSKPSASPITASPARDTPAAISTSKTSAGHGEQGSQQAQPLAEKDPFKAIPGPLPTPTGWKAVPCGESLPSLCITNPRGLEAEATLYRVPLQEAPDFRAMLSEAGLPTKQADLQTKEDREAALAALRKHAQAQLDLFEQEREGIYKSGERFEGIGPQSLSFGELPGVTFGFTTSLPDGRVVERVTAFLGFDGQSLYVMGLNYLDEPDRRWTDAERLRFQPYMRKIVSNLELTKEN